VKIDVVCTTVGDGAEFFSSYRELMAAGCEYDVRLVVIPDKKTPASLYLAAEAAGREMQVVCPNPDDQREMIKKLSARWLIPWDSDNRRNVGYLMALADGADMIISVDDDNFPGSDFFSEHSVVTQRDHKVREVICGGRWFNPCWLLGLDCWPRGFPYYARDNGVNVSRMAESQNWVTRVTVNAGLWGGEPDVDAVTRLAVSPVSSHLVGSAALGPFTWAPVNSQNTAVTAEAIPAYYFLDVDRHYGPGMAGRFGDIFQGYFVQACAKRLGHTVRFGTPAVAHKRNEHNLLNDLELELPYIRILERLLPRLTEAQLDGGSYADAYASLTEWLSVDANSKESGWNDWECLTLNFFADRMAKWLRVCRRITGA
jgi:reversibly glycosylated polypeptide